MSHCIRCETVSLKRMCVYISVCLFFFLANINNFYYGILNYHNCVSVWPWEVLREISKIQSHKQSLIFTKSNYLNF